MAEEIKVGDVVQLKSGGPDMTVLFIEEDYAVCNWFSENESKKDEFPLESLKKIDVEEIKKTNKKILEKINEINGSLNF